MSKQDALPKGSFAETPVISPVEEAANKARVRHGEDGPRLGCDGFDPAVGRPDHGLFEVVYCRGCGLVLNRCKTREDGDD